MTTRHILTREQLVPRPREDVFVFFSDPFNLEAITPGFLRFRIVTPGPIPMRSGALVDYRLALFGVPFGWQTRIEEWVPQERFVDVQLRGPYRLWHHLHVFEDAPGGTLVRDRVTYELPLGLAGDLAHALLVRRAIARIFDHRREAIARLLGGPSARPPALTPAVAGP
jgi:hypothetical protein